MNRLGNCPLFAHSGARSPCFGLQFRRRMLCVCLHRRSTYLLYVSPAHVAILCGWPSSYRYNNREDTYTISSRVYSNQPTSLRPMNSCLWANLCQYICCGGLARAGAHACPLPTVAFAEAKVSLQSLEDICRFLLTKEIVQASYCPVYAVFATINKIIQQACQAGGPIGY